MKCERQNAHFMYDHKNKPYWSAAIYNLRGSLTTSSVLVNVERAFSVNSLRVSSVYYMCTCGWPQNCFLTRSHCAVGRCV